MGITEKFVADVEAYLDLAGMDPTTFGKQAMRDPGFVFDLRKKDRAPTGRTMDKVHAWMRDNPPKANGESK